MADEETKKFLRKWGHDNLISIFEEQLIDIDTFKELTPESIKELIPLLGPRMKFLKQWKEVFGGNVQDQEPNGSNIQSNQSEETVDSVNPVENDEQQSESETDGEIENTESSQNEIVAKKRKKSFSSTQSEYRKRHKGETGSYVQSLLSNHNFFHALKKEYERNSFLSEKSSIVLCRIICDDLVTGSESRLTNSDFSDITDEIISIFPEEKHLTYFIPPVYKRHSKNNKSIRARGRLVDMFHNKLQTYRRMCGETKRQKNQTTMDNEDIEINDDIKCSLAWLEHNSDSHDFEKIKKHWKRTAKIRHQLLLKSEGNVADYLKKYPLLSDTKIGPILIDIDFDEIYPSASINFFEKWQTTIEKLLIIVGRKQPSKIVEDLTSKLLDEDITPHTKEFLQILLLPLLIPPRGALPKVKQLNWKPSAVESQRGIAIYAQPGKIEEVHIEKCQQMLEIHLTVQPYIIGVGTVETDVTDFYILVDKVRFRFESPLKALSTCFKIFFTWHAEYPPESQQVWLFIQRAFFGLKTEFDQEKPQVTHLLRAIKKYNKHQTTPETNAV